ncbi:hypothetical protein R1sor_019049 [Riccia sorocarpa]|uniref:Ribosomal RNA-processing protein 4 n=1 Tax=Riccia sorocarpa TaxID=122646 RepID=A0ABD3IBL0_9MARC
MKRTHFRLSPSQKQRLSQAQERCRAAAGGFQASAFVNVGDTIPVDYDNGFLRGHGTQLVEGQLLATVCGVVERVNKLISVRPLRARYNPETGDVVVGRITEVAPKRWKVDVNSRQDAQLLLSAVNLPGGIQRRRTATDELNMRDLFTENDVISAEVQTLHQDGSLHLHTRSLKYGKLENGQLVKVSPYLIKRLKQHFHQLKQYGVQLILGCNGYVWISAIPPSSSEIVAIQPATNQRAAESESRETGAGTPEAQNVEITRDLRERICRIANAVRVLGACGFMIHPDSIVDTYEASLTSGIEPKQMISGEFHVRTVEREADQRSKKGSFKGSARHLYKAVAARGDDQHHQVYVQVSISRSGSTRELCINGPVTSSSADRHSAGGWPHPT